MATLRHITSINDAGADLASYSNLTDAQLRARDFSGDRVRRSVEESFERLGISSCQLMYLHDPEYYMTFEEAMLPGGPVEALVKLKEEGVLKNIGIAAGPVAMLLDFVRTDLFQAVPALVAELGKRKASG